MQYISHPVGGLLHIGENNFNISFNAPSCAHVLKVIHLDIYIYNTLNIYTGKNPFP